MLSSFNNIVTDPELVTLALVVSAITFIWSLLIIPWLLTRIPEDYFCGDTQPQSSFRKLHPLAAIALFLVKNGIGFVLLALGLLLMVVPGQGILTILASSFLIEFPNKYRLQRWIVRRPGILKSINWLRQRRNHPPLRIDD